MFLKFPFLAVAAVALLSACTRPNSLTDENLTAGARAETYALGHGALCARLPTIEAIQLYSAGAVPIQSSIARTVQAWDKSGLLDIFRSNDGRWVILPSAEMKKLKGVHFRRGPSGENDALCFGRVWVDRVIDYEVNNPLGIEGAVTGRFEASLKDAHMLRYFKNLKVEPFDPGIFTLSTGVAYAESLSPSFAIVMALRPTNYGWYLARGVSPADDNAPTVGR